MFTTVLSFLFALGLLVAIHEYGHYRVAVACGVKVLRFSVGFGKPIVTWRLPGKPTEFVIGLIPLGGYVKMLDEREAPVASSERHLSFNTQPLYKRVAIVAAGPLANLILAVCLFAVVGMVGQQQALPIVGAPVAGSVADKAGVLPRDEVISAQRRSANAVKSDAAQDTEILPVRSFEELNWHLMRAVVDQEDLVLTVRQRHSSKRETQLVLPTSTIDARLIDASLIRQIGIVSPWSAPILGEVLPNGAGEKAGLRRADEVLEVDGVKVTDAQQLRELIRAAPNRTQQWLVQRRGQWQEIAVTPALFADDRPSKPGAAAGGGVGKIGAQVGAVPSTASIRYGVLESIELGFSKTWDYSVLTVQMFVRMLTGQASLKNLSGPLTIADYAGKSANLGLTPFLLFLAMVSVSLGVLNLLPLPVLDGGHLMYYLWEGLTGRTVSDVWQERMQRVGVAALLMMMSVAMFNDVGRLFGVGS